MDDDKPKQEYPKACALCGEPTTGHLPFCLDCKHRWQPDELGLEHSDYYSASDDYPEPAQTLLSQLEARLEKASQVLHVAETADRWRDARRLERAIKLLKSLTDPAQSSQSQTPEPCRLPRPFGRTCVTDAE